jgi:hypothetical protein
MEDRAVRRGSVKTAVRLLSGAAAALMILAVPAAASRVFAPRFVPAEALPVTLPVDDNLAAYGVRSPAAPAASTEAVPVKPADAPAFLQLQNWQYRGKPTINPPG